MWHNHRRALLPMFADRFLRKYGRDFVATTTLFCDKIVNASIQQGQPLEIHSGLSRLALDALGTSIPFEPRHRR